MKYFSITLLLISLPVLIFSQVNTEKYRKYGSAPGFQANIGFNLGLEKGNSDYLSTEANLRFDYNMLKSTIFLVGNMDYKDANGEKVKNKGFIHLRGIHKLKGAFNAEAFGQTEYNEFIDLNKRILLGVGLRINALNMPLNTDSTSSIRIRVGVGAMHENEEYQLPDNNARLTLNHIRLTNYLSFDWQLNKGISWSGVCYYQPSAKDFNDHRLLADSELEILLIKRLYFRIIVHYKYNSIPITKNEKYDLELKNGIRYQF